MKKKILALCLVVVLAVTAVTGATLAYFTDTKEATNTFTIGDLEIELTEPNWKAEDNKDVYPGEILPKDPTVKNASTTNPCFIRVSVSNLDMFGEDVNIVLVKKDGENYVDGLNTGWVLLDGYYYYTVVVAAGATTTAVFDGIKIPTEITNAETTKDIVVVAEAVQSEGFTGDITAANLKNWFNTCGFTG